MGNATTAVWLGLLAWCAGTSIAGEAPAKRDPSVVVERSKCSCRKCFVAETPNFRVHCCTSEVRLRELAESCEQWRARCQAAWLGEDSTAWSTRCEVVVHSTAGAYSKFLGPGSERTSGCSTIRIEQGQVVERRIDLRSDADSWASEGLPHELTHVVLADRFTKHRIPAWADEGIAMLAESPEKLEKRLNELRGIAATGKTVALRDLVQLADGPTPTARAAFYGQSVTLTGLLLERGTPDQFLQFVESGSQAGYDKALRDVYGIESWQTLEGEWRTFVGSQRLRKLAQHAVIGDEEKKVTAN